MDYNPKTLQTLIERDRQIGKEMEELEAKRDRVRAMIVNYLDRNEVDKAETDSFTVSVKDDYTLVWIDRKEGMEYLKKHGLYDKMTIQSFSAPALKKYCTETGDVLGGLVEISSVRRPTIRSKQSVKEGVSHGSATE